MLKSPHATIDVEEARHIAGNPDGCDKQDLMAFWNWAGCSQVRPLRQSRELWPDELMADVKGFERIGPNGRLEALSGIKGYVTNKSAAMACRERGDINPALMYESICERIYQELPEWAKW